MSRVLFVYMYVLNAQGLVLATVNFTLHLNGFMFL